MDKKPGPDAGPSLRALVDRLPSMLAFWDRGLLCRFANRAYEDWFGVDPDRLVGTSMQALLGPDLFALNEPHVRAALGGHEQTFERSVRHAHGVTRHSLISYLPYSAGGEVQGFIATVTEITPLKQAEERLQASIERLEAEARARREAEARLVDAEESLAVTLASIDAGFVAADREGRVTRLNEVAQSLLGWTQAEAQGQPVGTVIQREHSAPDGREANVVDLMKAAGVTVATVHEAGLLRRDGGVVAVETRAALTHGRDGTVLGAVFVLRDRSSARQAQIDASRLVAIVESSQDAIIGKTLAGEITDWNEAAQTLFGYSAEEALGRPVQMLIPPERQHEEMRILSALAHGVRVPPFDTVRRAKDGRLVEVSVTISPIRDAEGRIVGASKIARDVSLQRREEATRNKAQRLEAENRQVQEASRLKSLFLANMSHELRTPLNAIIGFADLLHAGVVSPESPKHHTYLGHIGTSGRHLLQLINDVLDLSKVDAGKFEFFPEALDLPVLVREVSDILQTSIEAKHLQLDVEIEPGLDGLVLDPSRLKQVLYNFLSNAIKFTEPGGRVTVRAQALGAARWRLSVQDTGVGIAAAQIQRLFTEFQQLDGGYTKHHQGTGLGLALTRRLVEAQGGSVGVQSEPGRGSTFYVLLNRVHGSDLAGQHSARGDREAPSRALLLIEDDHQVQARMRGALAAAGFHVHSAHTARQALTQAQGTPFDALTLKLRLAGGDGLGVLADIRHAGGSAASPVVAMSLAAKGGVASFAIEDILSKPLRSAEVAAALGRFKRPHAAAPVLVIDDDPLALAVMHDTLRAIGLTVVCEQDARLALRQLDLHEPCAIVLDLMMPGFDGFAALDALQALPRWRATPVFIWTSLLLTDEEYASLAVSAQAILSKGGGGLAVMLERLRHWQPAAAAAAAEGGL